jgi:hypothetical protein
MAQEWNAPKWWILGWRGVVAAFTLLLFMSAIGTLPFGDYKTALWIGLFFGAEALFAFVIGRSTVTRLQWRGDELMWKGILGNTGTVRADDIVSVTSGIQPGRSLIKLKSRGPLRANGGRYRELREFIYGPRSTT